VVLKLGTEKSCCACPVSLKLHHVVSHCLGKLLPITGWRGKGHAVTLVLQLLAVTEPASLVDMEKHCSLSPWPLAFHCALRT